MTCTIYLGATEAAARANMAPTVFSSMCSTGRGPDPDCLVGTARGFLPETIDQWVWTRSQKAAEKLATREAKAAVAAEAKAVLTRAAEAPDDPTPEEIADAVEAGELDFADGAALVLNQPVTARRPARKPAAKAAAE